MVLGTNLLFENKRSNSLPLRARIYYWLSKGTHHDSTRHTPLRSAMPDVLAHRVSHHRQTPEHRRINEDDTPHAYRILLLTSLAPDEQRLADDNPNATPTS